MVVLPLPVEPTIAIFVFAEIVKLIFFKAVRDALKYL
jgi:hypothetical protein